MKSIQELMDNPPVCKCGVIMDVWETTDCNTEKCNDCFTDQEFCDQYGLN